MSSAFQGLLSSDDAVLLVEPRHLDQLLHPVFEEGEEELRQHVLAVGLNASPGRHTACFVRNATK